MAAPDVAGLMWDEFDGEVIKANTIQETNTTGIDLNPVIATLTRHPDTNSFGFGLVGPMDDQPDSGVFICTVQDHLHLACPQLGIGQQILAIGKTSLLHCTRADVVAALANKQDIQVCTVYNPEGYAKYDGGLELRTVLTKVFSWQILSSDLYSCSVKYNGVVNLDGLSNKAIQAGYLKIKKLPPQPQNKVRLTMATSTTQVTAISVSETDNVTIVHEYIKMCYCLASGAIIALVFLDEEDNTTPVCHYYSGKPKEVKKMSEIISARCRHGFTQLKTFMETVTDCVLVARENMEYNLQEDSELTGAREEGHEAHEDNDSGESSKEGEGYEEGAYNEEKQAIDALASDLVMAFSATGGAHSSEKQVRFGVCLEGERAAGESFPSLDI